MTHEYSIFLEWPLFWLAVLQKEHGTQTNPSTQYVISFLWLKCIAQPQKQQHSSSTRQCRKYSGSSFQRCSLCTSLIRTHYRGPRVSVCIRYLTSNREQTPQWLHQLAHYCFNTPKVAAFQATEFDGNYQIQQWWSSLHQHHCLFKQYEVLESP